MPGLSPALTPAPREAGLWILATLLVLAVHGLALVAVSSRSALPPEPAVGPAILMDLAPQAEAVETSATEVGDTLRDVRPVEDVPPLAETDLAPPPDAPPQPVPQSVPQPDPQRQADPAAAPMPVPLPLPVPLPEPTPAIAPEANPTPAPRSEPPPAPDLTVPAAPASPPSPAVPLPEAVPEPSSAVGPVPALPVTPTPARPSPPKPSTRPKAATQAPAAPSKAAKAEVAPSNRVAAPATSAGRAAAAAPVPAAWRAQVMAALERHKRPPRLARQDGTVVIRFDVDEGGRVLAVSVSRSSGNPALDAAAVDMVRRASPLPAPPAGTNRSVTAPVRFTF